ncbi:unnamed protein product, partial [marine sediment metagenome]
MAIRLKKHTIKPEKDGGYFDAYFPANRIPNSGLTIARNIRYKEGRIQNIYGIETFLATPTAIKARIIDTLASDSGDYFMVGSDNKIYTYDAGWVDRTGALSPDARFMCDSEHWRAVTYCCCD